MKKYHKIILAGGNGYLGTVLSNYYESLADEVVVLSRNLKSHSNNIRTVIWNGQTLGDWTTELENADLLINLCGKNVNCRYTEKNKQAIISSRIIPTALLGKAVKQLQHPPKLWINVTSATIYRHAEDCAQDELKGEEGTGFSVEVCRLWEKTFFEADMPHTRKIALRMGIVFGKDDGVYPRLLNLVKLGLGGKQGNGRQLVSWIHEQDVAQITEWLLLHPELAGIINCTAPEVISNAREMMFIRQAYHRTWGLPAPEWLLGIGAFVIRTETELILKSRWVVPQILLDSGYKFTYPTFKKAVESLC
ncbi:TIGR01777 family protein [Mucilaginibacter robiniae]|uniref:TIGR01777 family protein n=1 Tax=Mucilaginibacter robiniae TaxID=2728022 RepID=A0A7L5E415_9SPHI|nr:TIGR01777 family oxidoreductase [Mucilaginibacter robiniae]QJD98062.1 TIGR01777 family protein [Mucilaginibacter robiniae]